MSKMCFSHSVSSRLHCYMVDQVYCMITAFTQKRQEIYNALTIIDNVQ